MTDPDDYQAIDCTGVLLGPAQFDDMRAFAWTPTDRTPERTPLETHLPHVLAFAEYVR